MLNDLRARGIGSGKYNSGDIIPGYEILKTVKQNASLVTMPGYTYQHFKYGDYLVILDQTNKLSAYNLKLNTGLWTISAIGRGVWVKDDIVYFLTTTGIVKYDLLTGISLGTHATFTSREISIPIIVDLENDQYYEYYGNGQTVRRCSLNGEILETFVLSYSFSYAYLSKANKVIYVAVSSHLRRHDLVSNTYGDYNFPTSISFCPMPIEDRTDDLYFINSTGVYRFSINTMELLSSTVDITYLRAVTSINGKVYTVNGNGDLKYVDGSSLILVDTGASGQMQALLFEHEKGFTWTQELGTYFYMVLRENYVQLT